VTDTPQNATGNKEATIKIFSIRGDPKYSQCSHEMLKVLDMFAMKQQNVPNFEFKAMTDFNQNSTQYPLLN
jgi:hypothetical protein